MRNGSLKKFIQSDPKIMAKNLFDETLEDFSKTKVALIIGKGYFIVIRDDYHNRVLVEYMNCFNFADVHVDEAFRFDGLTRQLCEQLYLTGETQTIDRILFQLSRRYWDCNPAKHNLYITVGKII